MPSFLIHETQTCEVTFVRRVEADDLSDACNMAHDGDGDLIGLSVGDTVASGYERTEVFYDDPINIPVHFYKEPST